jgi:trehalose 6-phosphate synthase
VIAGKADTPLTLFENAGATEELGEHALLVNPFDTLATSASIERALTMPSEERRARAARLKEIVGGGEDSDWSGLRLEAAATGGRIAAKMQR